MPSKSRSAKIRKAVIPAAGLGTRFLPATKAVPKEMLPIVDVPMIQIIVEEAVRAGIQDVILVTARHKSAIEDHFDSNFELEETLDRRQKKALADVSRAVSKLCNLISVRQKNPLGLGHAVLQAAPIVGDEPFAILLGDELMVSEKPSITQLTEVYERTGQSCVAVMEVPESDVSKYGIVGGKADSPGLIKVDRIIEKPSAASAPSRFALPGRYVLDPKIFEYLREVRPGAGGEIQLTDGLEMLARNEGLWAKTFEGRRFDTGDRIGYLDATLHFALQREDTRSGAEALIRKYAQSIGKT